MLPLWVYTLPFVEGGRSREGADCWGLIVLLYKHFFDIDLCKYEGVAATTLDYDNAAEKIKDETESHKDFDLVDTPKFGDVILLRIKGRPVHVGFCLDDTTMIHTSYNHGVVIENFTEMKWKTRILGFYRKK